ncbi:MAG TPA: tRNA adenosine(34) deaminase TadA [Candidatus Latescibacteria bacterium]|nr:tRNA adenosine(34) deaminase TadA [Candidatus Latescibacterota bacterium]HOM57041.1 tRNA adenosine(34) deaminase TadA [Candidatus Latescibacterota bacterium]HOS64909.1 tRNA adenosine(34) deaminase TadA [Candidatus Latescibacterota bacterium]HPK74083.1 tRNA adenosine(34) deaminase TadA [Candidatus Latescibacterota bacterium]
MDRIPDHETWMRLALAEARAALYEQEVPVGAVVVRDGIVIGRGHNTVETGESALNHAEMLALREATQAVGAWRLNDAVLYVTLEPCMMCAGALMLSRIGGLVFGARDPKFGACGSRIDALAPEMGWNHRVNIISGVLADESAALLREFFSSRR